MSYHEALTQIIRQELARKLPPEVFEDQVVEKKMFGGLAFVVRGKMAITASGREGVEAMVRTGPERQEVLLPRTGARVTVMRGHSRKGYIDLDAEGVKELPFWIEQALAFNEELTRN